MLQSIQNALRDRKRDQKGFSLVELAVVIVIIGILVAIAVPVFMGIQDSAKQSNIDAAAANGSATAAAGFANGDDVATINTDLKKIVAQEGASDYIESLIASGTEISDYCVTATAVDGAGTNAEKGPGC